MKKSSYPRMNDEQWMDYLEPDCPDERSNNMDSPSVTQLYSNISLLCEVSSSEAIIGNQSIATTLKLCMLFDDQSINLQWISFHSIQCNAVICISDYPYNPKIGTKFLWSSKYSQTILGWTKVMLLDVKVCIQID